MHVKADTSIVSLKRDAERTAELIKNHLKKQQPNPKILIQDSDDDEEEEEEEEQEEEEPAEEEHEEVGR